MDTRITKENFHWVWKTILIHATDEYQMQQVVIRIGHSTISTLGNFSASTGKSKSKKTFNVCAITAAALTNQKILNYDASFPDEKRKILYFDTEQSSYHCHKVLKRILQMAGFPDGQDCDRIEFVMLREFSPVERRQIIDLALAEHTDVGLVVIDGLRDLLYDINSSTESAEVIGLLMKWTSQYNLHIHTVLHLNKGDDNVRGHIGTELNHKAETILQVRVNEGDMSISEVRPSYIRDRDFAPFAFRINDSELPEIVDGVDFRKAKKNEPVDYRMLSEETHRKALDMAFDVNEERPVSDPITYTPLLNRMIDAYAEAGYSRQLGVHKNLLKYLTEKGIIMHKDRAYVYNRNIQYVLDPEPESVQSGLAGI
ncbi:MAG: AAA family ATPase [Bacteroidales bacterium]|nr:AAA family ATPase [Bacteroidales bacterium]